MVKAKAPAKAWTGVPSRTTQSPGCRLALDGKCLQDPGGRTASGTRVRIENCVPGATERWTVVADGTIRVNFRCLDIAGAGSSSAGQAWTFETDGTLRMFGSKCLTVRGKKAVIWTCGAAGNQKWTVVRTGAMSSVLTQGGVCLAVPSLTAAKGTLLEPIFTQLITSKCSTTDPRDLWHIA